MSELWINKYKPNELNKLIGKNNAILEISNWINNLKNSKIQTLIVSGHHGVGKSILVKLLLEKFNYDSLVINQNDIKSYRNKDSLRGIFDSYNSEKINKLNFKKRIALIFDGAESITLSSEKKYIMEIFKKNNKSKSFPLIFITNLHHNKIINDIKKQSLYVEVKFPSNNEIMSILSYISKKEKIKIKKSAIEILINYSEKDMRKLLYLFQDVHNNFSNEIIDSKKLMKFLESSKRKIKI